MPFSHINDRKCSRTNKTSGDFIYDFKERVLMMQNTFMEEIKALTEEFKALTEDISTWSPWMLVGGAIFIVFPFVSLMLWLVYEKKEKISMKRRMKKEMANGIFDGVDSKSRELIKKFSGLINELDKSADIPYKIRREIGSTFVYVIKFIDRDLCYENYILWRQIYKRKSIDIINRNKLIVKSVSAYRETINDMYENREIILKSESIRILILEKVTLILENTAQMINIYDEETRISNEKALDLVSKNAVEKINSNFNLESEGAEKDKTKKNS